MASPRSYRVEAALLLSDFIRDELGLTGTHVGCEHGVCGACTILFDGEAARSCLMFAVQADGADIETIEGLSGSGAIERTAGAVRRASRPAMRLLHARDADRRLRPAAAFRTLTDREKFARACRPSLCRCTGYDGIVKAVSQAARRPSRGESGGGHQSRATVHGERAVGESTSDDRSPARKTGVC